MISRFNRLISNVELHFVSLRACLSRRQFSRFLINDLPKKLRVEIGNVGKNIHGTSEIVYGIQPALAALIAKQRRVSCIFIRDDLHELSHDALFKKNPWLAAIVQLAPPDIQVKRVSRDFLTVLTNGRNNQGVAIECSPIPMPSVHGISAHSLLHFNHCMSSLPKPLACCNSSSIVLFLDRVQDVMNMGSILRSAVFFGVPCVLISAFFSATPTPLISKLSSGAMESLRFFRVTNPVATLKQLSEVGFIVVGTAGMQVGIEENFKYRPPSDLAFIKPEMVRISVDEAADL